jgi:thioredoxin 1
MPVEATVETYGDLTGEGSVLVDFWGPRCQPCLAMMPTIAKLEEETGGAVRVVKVNSAENREICRELRVFGLPTYVLMRDGEELERLSGEVSKDDIERACAEVMVHDVGGEEGDRARRARRRAGSCDRDVRRVGRSRRRLRRDGVLRLNGGRGHGP